jgi:hypothetical protein
MSNFGFTILGLIIIGDSVEPAQIIFTNGLNLVSGVSNTGKSYIRECIDYMLGGGNPPKEIPQSKEYHTIYMEIVDKKGNYYTLARSLKTATTFFLYNSKFSEITDRENHQTLGAKKSPKKNDISSFLMALSGMEDVKVKKDSLNHTEVLSFRTLSKLFIVKETDIISEESPLSPKFDTERTKQSSIFKYLLTGKDDSQLIRSEDPKIVNAQQRARIEVYDKLISELESKLERLLDGSKVQKIREKITEINNKIEQVSNVISSSSESIRKLTQFRQETWLQKRLYEDRSSEIEGLLNKFNILQQQYTSDLKRLEFTSDGEYLFNQLELVNCPLCGNKLTSHQSQSVCINKKGELVSIQQASEEEIKKIEINLRDLQITIDSLIEEREDVESIIKKSGLIIADTENTITQTLAPQEITKRNELEELQAIYRVFAEVEASEQQLNLLKKAKSEIEFVKPDANKTVSAGQALEEKQEFCSTVSNLLGKWNYPNSEIVTFNEQTMDILIDGHPRKSDGKGYRAISYSAFILGLMEYCKNNNLPHTNFVLLDSPLTTFQEEVTGNVQNALWEDLANNYKDEQIIVLENKIPKNEILEKITFHYFIGNNSNGRSGFYT